MMLTDDDDKRPLAAQMTAAYGRLQHAYNELAREANALRARSEPFLQELEVLRSENEKLSEIVRVHTNRVKGCLCEACSDAEYDTAMLLEKYMRDHQAMEVVRNTSVSIGRIRSVADEFMAIEEWPNVVRADDPADALLAWKAKYGGQETTR